MPKGSPALSHVPSLIPGDLQAPWPLPWKEVWGEVAPSTHFPISCSHLTGCLSSRWEGSGHFPFKQSDMPSACSSPRAYPRTQAQSVPQVLEEFFRWYLCPSHTCGALAARGCGEHLSLMLRECFPASPRPPGRGTSRAARNGVHTGNRAGTHVPPSGLLQLMLTPALQPTCHPGGLVPSKWGSKGPASAPRTPGTAPAPPRLGTDVTEATRLPPVSRGHLRVPRAHGLSGDSGARGRGSLPLPPPSQALVTQACADCRLPGPRGKLADQHQRDTAPTSRAAWPVGADFLDRQGLQGLGAGRGFESSPCASQGQRAPSLSLWAPRGPSLQSGPSPFLHGSARGPSSALLLS